MRTGGGQSRLTAVGTALPVVFAGKQWDMQWRLFCLSREWAEIVGDNVARLTAPAFFRKGTLWIFVQDSTWMHDLQYVKADLIARINRHLEGRFVADIRWKLYSSSLAQSGQQFHAPKEIDPGQEQAFCQMVETIANQQCREALERLWRTFAAHAE
jgi:Uncharacterized protein conserved in bacteria